MKLNNFYFSVIFIGVLVFVGIISACFWGDDNPLEERAEELIRYQTGIEIDLTPASPEVKTGDKN